MKSINIFYNEMKDMKESITMLKREVKKIDKEWNNLLVEIRETVFNAAQGAQLYKRTQEFLQERRLLNGLSTRMSLGCRGCCSVPCASQ